MNWVLLKSRLGLKENRWQEMDKAKTTDQSLMFTKNLCLYRGKAHLPQTHSWWLLPACKQFVWQHWFGKKVSITGLPAVSGISQESLSLSAGSSVSEKNSTCDRTIEPSRWEGSTPGDLFLSGSNVWASSLKAGEATIESGTIRRYGLVRGNTLLWRQAVMSPLLKLCPVTQPFSPVCRSRCRALSSFSRTMSASMLPCFPPW